MARQTNSEKATELRAVADRMEKSVSSTDGPSSENWVSWERREQYFQMAAELRRKADKLEKEK